MSDIITRQIVVGGRIETIYAYRESYARTCLPDAEWQRCKLEALRHKWRYHDADVRFMQRLGDIGRSLGFCQIVGREVGLG